uniref:Uncharacterized protein n=1 Tax=Percolomonas cosmopolitus TaxID=63605 RepID=A0A7S1KSR5_9EUKA
MRGSIFVHVHVHGSMAFRTKSGKAADDTPIFELALRPRNSCVAFSGGWVSGGESCDKMQSLSHAQFLSLTGQRPFPHTFTFLFPLIDNSLHCSSSSIPIHSLIPFSHST